MKAYYTISILVLTLFVVAPRCENPSKEKASDNNLRDSVIITPDTNKLTPARIILKKMEVSSKTITGSAKFFRSRVLDETEMNRLSVRLIDSTAPRTAEAFKYHIVDTLFSNSTVTAILIGREYPEENILWLATYDSNDKLVDQLMVYYDNSEGAIQVGSVIKEHEVVITSFNEYAESPREAKKTERYKVDENSRFLKIR